MAATVESAFVLRDGASSTVREIRRELRGLQADAESAGRSLDNLSGPAAARELETVARSQQGIRNEFQSTERAVDQHSTQIEARLDRLEGRFRDLGEVTARPSVELGGFDRANAELSALEARLDRLDRRRASPRVAVGLSGGGFAGGGGGGSGMNGGGGRPPTLFSAAGGVPGIALGALGLSPAILGLLGGAAAVASSAGSAALGAGSVGLGGLGPLAVGGGLTALAGKQALSGLQTVTKAQQAYNEAVADYGRRSTQAATAQRKLIADMAANPAAAAAAADLTRFQSQATAAFAPARGQFYRGMSGVLANATRALPAVGPAARVATGASASAAITYSHFLTNPAQLSMVRQLTDAFASDLPTAERSLENITATVGHLAVAAVPFFKEGNNWVEHWTAGLAKSSSDTLRVQGRMHDYVNSAKDWAGLAGAAYRDIKDLFDAGAPTGDSMVVELTHTLDRWDAWLQRNPQKVQGFFEQSATTTGKIATAMGGVLTDVEQLASALAPVFDRLTDVLSFLTGLGPGGLGLVGTLLYGGYEGLRGQVGGPSAASLAGAFVTGSAGPGLMRRPGMAAAGSALVVGGGAAAGGAARRASNFEVATGRTRAGAILMGPATEGTAGAVARRAGLGSAAETGLLGGLAVSSPTAGRVADAVTGLRGLGGAVLESAAKFALPILAITSVLQGAQTRGTLGDKFQGGINSALHLGSFGVLPKDTVQRLLGDVNAGASLSNPATAASLRGIQTSAGGVRNVSQLQQVQRSIGDVQIGAELAPDDQRKLTAFLTQASNVAAQNAGTSASNTWATAFQAALNRGEKPQKAVETMLSGMEDQLRQLGPKGARAFASSTAQWIAQMEEDNPRLRKPLDRLTAGIVGDLNQMDRTTGTKMSDLRDKIFYFNGQILAGSTRTWKLISSALTDPAQVAQEKLEGIFGQIQVEAINALTGMGFSRQQARQIVTEQSAGGQLAANAGAAVATKQATGKSVSPLGAAPSNLPKRAMGGRAGAYRLPGTGTLDSVAMADGGYGAPGEIVLNQHTERDVDRDLVMAGRPSLEQRVRRETRKHYQPGRATGGRVVTASDFGGPGDPGTGSHGYRGDDLYAHPDSFAELNMGTALGGLPYLAPVDVTYHGKTARLFKRDIGAGGPGLNGHVRAIDLWFQAAQALGFGGLGDVTVNGGSGVNIRVAGGGGAAGPVGGGSIGALKVPGSGLGGVPGALATAAGRAYAAGLRQHVNKRLAAMAPASGGVSIAGGGATSGPPGLSVFEGVTMAKWIANELEWGTQHGWHGQPTSGYRPGFDPFAPSGSEHALINYPGGAVDFGGFTDPAAYQTKLALVELAARLNYPGPRLKMPIGFHDDGHLSGTGHALGGRLSGPAWGGWNAKGADVMVRRPTLFGAGEHGAERVQITPQRGPGGSGVSVGSVQVNVTGGISERRVHKLLDRRLKQFAQDVAAEIEAGAEEPAGVTIR